MLSIRSFAGSLIALGLCWPVPTLAADTGAAVKKGAEYLESQFARGGEDASRYKVGSPALAGIALLESGVKPDSPGLAAIIKTMRAEALAQTETYPVALSILFFDKLAEKTGENTDIATIQHLGVRLYAGLNATGGWGYSTWDAMSAQELERVTAALRKDELTTKPAEKPNDAPKKPDDGFLKPGTTPVPANAAKIHPEAARLLLNVQQAIKARGRGGVGGFDDNSNTQFGLIGLWVASRHGVPANDAFALIEARFLRSQGRQDFGWTYTPSLGGLGNSTPSMTCAGLLGLAVGAGSRNALIAEAKKPAESTKPTDDDPFTNPKGKPAKPAANTIAGKPAELALMSMGKFLAGARPNGQANGFAGLTNFIGSGNVYYLLWCVERVGMAYGLDTIGDIDWYEWGCGYLLPAQGQDGSWADTSYGSVINTSFALLFLTKSNSVRDLSNKIKGKVRDPGKTELRAGAGSTPALFAPPPKEGDKPETKPDTKLGGPGFTLPTVLPPNEEAEIQKISTTLTTATDDNWKTKLDEARDAKGSKWTRGLVFACGNLDAEKKREAREALADRLTRMTAKSLREMLGDPDAELRRAACLAAGMKEEKLLIPALIERITDPSEIVVRAAKASLKAMSQADFGPSVGADEESKIKAAATWRAWFEALPK